ncbi:hypothetical protein E8E13_011388 [Curvularia kusanoi]|uniref:Uncharacterized protein n=1 Tax=Curvularia kusanoi TaxID=90978 RepID=A0A9P4TQ38_CURKU|nr:hypothetical protein E8E13_011388 [Curvularia kusanoi]
MEPDTELAPNTSNHIPLADDRVAPTAEEETTLRKVIGHIPPIAYLICLVELAERASFYGVKGVFNNFMQFPLPKAAISRIVSALIQWRVYKTSPCGYNASTCKGVSPISIWWQLPNVILGAISEIFVNITGYELAYARALLSMKSIVFALCLFTTALSTALLELLIPAIKDPHLVWVWAGPAIALLAQTVLFVWRHRNVNDDEFMVYEDEVVEISPAVETKGN